MRSPPTFEEPVERALVPMVSILAEPWKPARVTMNGKSYWKCPLCGWTTEPIGFKAKLQSGDYVMCRPCYNEAMKHDRARREHDPVEFGKILRKKVAGFADTADDDDEGEDAL